ncbi:MAG: hypothetical protein ACRDQ5_17160, partial [Sciscionella sp.]
MTEPGVHDHGQPDPVDQPTFTHAENGPPRNSETGGPAERHASRDTGSRVRAASTGRPAAVSSTRWKLGGAQLWRSAYLRAVRSAFATVPLYRETWALSGRTEPVLVPGRTGSYGGAIRADEVVRKLVDTVPLAGGTSTPDPARGLSGLLPLARPGALGGILALVDGDIAQLPTHLPRGTRSCLVHPDALSCGHEPAALREIEDTARRGELVLAVGADKALDALGAALPGVPGYAIARVPHRGLDQLDGGHYGLLHDRLLGYLG